MKNSQQSPLIRLILAGCLLSFQVNAAWEKDREYALTILHTNDHHGRFWQNEHGEYGLAAQHTLVSRIRDEIEKKQGNLLLLSGGDINTGVPESDMLNAEPDFIGMKKIGYDAMALGNHEFDNPIQILWRQQAQAGFPFLSANIYDNRTNKRLFPPYAIFDKQGLKIAVIGLTTEDTARIANIQYVENLIFTDPKIEAQRVIDELNVTEKPDVIIAVTHMGHYDNAQHGSNAPGDVSLARALTKGSLAMIIGGHSQTPVCMAEENRRVDNYKPTMPCPPDRQNGTWIMQAHEWGKYVGRADFIFKNGELTLRDYALLPVNLKYEEKDNAGLTTYLHYGEVIPDSTEMLTLLKSYQEKGQQSLNTVIGRSDVVLDGDRSSVRQQQTNLGKLIALAQLTSVNADFGLVNSGGVRDSIPAGPITYRDILKVQPFGNTLAYAQLRGGELINYLNVVARKTAGSGGYPQFANITFMLEGDHIGDIRIGGKPFDQEKIYRFSLPSFCAQGGDGYPKIDYIETGNIDADILKRFIEANSPITTALLTQ